jgi:Flp pilus assembly pilin Flp
VAALRFATRIEQDESGQTMAEYAVVLAVVTLLVVASISMLAVNVAGQIARIASYIHFS